MIRAFQEQDQAAVMQIWLDTNIQAHDFIPADYWTGHYEMVRDSLPQAEVYVHEDDHTRQIDGFIGLTDDYIEGIFVHQTVQSKGIGRQLLDHAKGLKPALRLRVYEKNSRAVAFYRREQFVIRSEGLDHATNETEFLMVWEA